MTPTTDFIRPMRRDEQEQVDALVRLCFDGNGEAELVAKLRASRSIAGEMVLTSENTVVGYYATSWMQKPTGWLCLAPVAIHPDFQGRGLGRRLIGQLASWSSVTRKYIVVLGAVPFYERCGFSAARAANLVTPYPSEHMLLAGPGQDAPAQSLHYPAAFAGLD